MSLQRFVDAQEPIYDQVLTELRSGIKRGHWIWYIFPQISGLGLSPMSEKYALRSIEEAEAYLAHPVLGPRLIECVETVNGIEGRSVEQIFGHPDYLKFRSCLTLFELVQGRNEVFKNALDRFYAGTPDRLTIEALNRNTLKQ